MYLLIKFDGHRSCKNGNIVYINSYTSTLEKVEPTASVSYTKIFSKSGIPIYYSEVPDEAGKKQDDEEEELGQL